MRHPATRSRPAYALLAVLASAALLLAGCGHGPPSSAVRPTMHTDLSDPSQQASPTPVSGSHGAEQVHLRFEVRTKGTLDDRRVFYGAYAPVSGGPHPDEPVPELAEDSSYVTVRLTDSDGDGRYTGEFSLEPGRYLVGIFTGLGTTGEGYPATSVDLISQDSGDFSEAVYHLREDRTITAVFPPPPGGEPSVPAQHRPEG